jgi:hypothetical protein
MLWLRSTNATGNFRACLVSSSTCGPLATKLARLLQAADGFVVDRALNG